MDTKNITNRKKQALSTKKKIFEQATKLFTTQSYEKVTIKDICIASNISIGAFYHHFSSKESILNAGYILFDEELKNIWTLRPKMNLIQEIIFIIKFQLEKISSGGFIYATQFFKNQLSNKIKYILDENRYFYKILSETIQKGYKENIFFDTNHNITKELLRISRGTIYDWCLHEGSYNLIECGLQDIKLVLKFHSSVNLPDSYFLPN